MVATACTPGTTGYRMLRPASTAAHRALTALSRVTLPARPSAMRLFSVSSTSSVPALGPGAGKRRLSPTRCLLTRRGGRAPTGSLPPEASAGHRSRCPPPPRGLCHGTIPSSFCPNYSELAPNRQGQDPSTLPRADRLRQRRGLRAQRGAG